MNTTTTRTVTFTYGTAKDAILRIPVGPFSIAQAGDMMMQSYLDYLFNGRSLFSDEVAVSSIGHDNFFAGALGGYESRLDADGFKMLRDYVSNNLMLAVAVVRRRNPTMTLKDAYAAAANNEALTDSERSCLKQLASI